MKMSKLLALALVLLISVGTLAGSTIAWFTDQVVSKTNKIESGTLDINLALLDKTGTWTPIPDEDGPALFTYDRWEPGYTDVKILKVTNDGNLALKWKAKIVTVDGTVGKLADAIDVYTCVGATEYPADRTMSGWVKEATLREFINNAETKTVGNLAGGASATLGIALKMREEAGNEYQGLSLGEFDIQILATQDTVELDGFGDNLYDKDAEFIPTPKSVARELTSDEMKIDIVQGLESFANKLPTGCSFYREKTATLDYGVVFSTDNALDEFEVDEYGDWRVDFEISSTKKLEEDDLTPHIVLAGHYRADFLDAYIKDDNDFIAFNVAGVELPADQPARLMTSILGNTMKYEEIVETVRTFKCGVIILDDDYFANEKITVKLCMYETDGHGNEIEGKKPLVIEEFSYTVPPKA